MKFFNHIMKGSLFWAVLLAWVLVVSCDDVFEEDITNAEVFLVAPSQGVEIDSGAVTFLWEHLEGATEYELLVLSPDFDNPATVHGDTITSDNSFVTALGPGEYAWGVRGLNSAFSTAFFVNTFTVLEAERDADITSSRVRYLSPANGTTAAEGDVVFLWEPLADARRYQFQIVSPGFTVIRQVVTDTITEETQITVTLDSGNYEWRVQGINNATRTDSAVVRRLSVD